MVGWSKGTRMRLTSRSRTEDRESLRDGRWSEGGVEVRTHVNRRRPMSAGARRRLAGYVASHLGHRCTSHSRAPWRHGSNDACGRSHVAIATPGPTGSGRDHGTGSRWSEGSQGGRGWGLRRLRCRFSRSARQSRKRCQSERKIKRRLGLYVRT
jgi:hypothetical protein